MKTDFLKIIYQLIRAKVYLETNMAILAIKEIFQGARLLFDIFDVDKDGILEGEELEKFLELAKSHPQAKMEAESILDKVA
jgi:Ca2+-binding EF-hand superfamily protein